MSWTLQRAGCAGRGCGAVVFLYGIGAVAALPLLCRGGKRGAAQVHGHAGTPTPSMCFMPTLTISDPTKYSLEKDKLSLMDRWILSKLNSLVKYVDESLDKYVITEPARAMQAFVDELSNWYVRRSRERYWGSDMTQDKINAYMTLYTVLYHACKDKRALYSVYGGGAVSEPCKARGCFGAGERASVPLPAVERGVYRPGAGGQHGAAA